MTDNPDQTLAPEFAAILERAKCAGAPELHTLSPQQARRQYTDGVRAVAGDPPAVVAAESREIESQGIKLGARLYRPESSGQSLPPILVYFHGGGWSFGDLDTHDHICRWLCLESRSLIFSIDYRLAPEHKFPAAVDDALAAVEWTARNAHLIGADPAKLSVGGDSAGGNLAAVVALLARDRGGPAIARQLLIYPATDMSMRFRSHSEFGDAYRLTRPLMLWSALNYLHDGNDILDPRASPLLAPNHKDLPPAIIVTAGFDPLRDEGFAYAERLRDQGVKVLYRCFDGAIHGFAGMTGVSEMARAALGFAGAALSAPPGGGDWAFSSDYGGAR